MPIMRENQGLGNPKIKL